MFHIISTREGKLGAESNTFLPMLCASHLIAHLANFDVLLEIKTKTRKSIDLRYRLCCPHELFYQQTTHGGFNLNSTS